MKQLIVIAACFNCLCLGMSAGRAAIAFPRLFTRKISFRAEHNCIVKQCDCLKKWTQLKKLIDEGIEKENHLYYIRSTESNSTVEEKQEARLNVKKHNDEIARQKGLLGTNIVEKAKCREIMFALGVSQKLLD